MKATSSSRNLRFIFLSVMVTVSLLTATQADEITQSVNSTNDSSSNWNTAIWGDPAAVPSFGNSYISDGSITPYLRTGNYNNANFDYTLTLINGVTLINKSSNVNFVDIILEDNSVLHAGDNGNTFQETTTIYVAGGQSGTLYSDGNPNVRTQTFESIISGSGTLNASGFQTSDSNIIDQSLNTFSGLWTVSTSTLVGVSDGSLGTGSFEVNSGGVLDIQYGFSDSGTTSGLSVSTGGLFNLNSGITSYFNAVSLGGSALGAGTYSYGDLDGGQQAFFSDADGTGSIVVIPESSTLGLFLAGLFAAFCLMRRKGE